MLAMRVKPIITLELVELLLLFGGSSRSLQVRGLIFMLSIQSRSSLSNGGTVESAPPTLTPMLTMEARSSKSSLLAVMSIISNLVMPAALLALLPGGLDEVTSALCCEHPLDVDTTLLLFRLMDKVVVEDMEPTELGELRFKSVMPLLLLLEERTGSMVKDDPMETVVSPAG